MTSTLRRIAMAFGLLATLEACRATDAELPTPPPAPPLRSLDDAPAPATFDEALLTLRQRMPARVLVAFIEAPDENVTSTYHESLGRWLRNNWGLWQRGPLYQDLRRRGLEHPDDMSAVLLTSVWRQLHGRPVALEEQVETFRQFWQKSAPPPTPK